MTLAVGGDPPHCFSIHRKILASSPVFAAMCSSRWREGSNGSIDLPDDDPDAIGRMIEYLYGQKDEAFTLKMAGRDQADKLMQLYVLGDKYGLGSFQGMALDRLGSLKCMCQDYETFFNVMSNHFADVPSTDVLFHLFFRTRGVSHIRCMSKERLQQLASKMESGGPFATKVFSMLIEARFDVSKDEADRTYKVKAQLDKARRMHQSQHPRCLQCHVFRGWSDEDHVVSTTAIEVNPHNSC